MSTCEQCGTDFACGMVEGSDAPCWCTQLPPLPPGAYTASTGTPAAAQCLCPTCLRKRIDTFDQTKDGNSTF